MPNKDQVRLIRAFKGLIHWAKTQLNANATVKVFFSDNDASLGLDDALFAQDEGIQILHSARYADSQHGKPERAGGGGGDSVICFPFPASRWLMIAHPVTNGSFCRQKSDRSKLKMRKNKKESATNRSFS